MEPRKAFRRAAVRLGFLQGIVGGIFAVGGVFMTLWEVRLLTIPGRWLMGFIYLMFFVIAVGTGWLLWAVRKDGADVDFKMALPLYLPAIMPLLVGFLYAHHPFKGEGPASIAAGLTCAAIGLFWTMRVQPADPDEEKPSRR